MNDLKILSFDVKSVSFVQDSSVGPQTSEVESLQQELTQIERSIAVCQQAIFETHQDVQKQCDSEYIEAIENLAKNISRDSDVYKTIVENFTSLFKSSFEERVKAFTERSVSYLGTLSERKADVTKKLQAAIKKVTP